MWCLYFLWMYGLQLQHGECTKNNILRENWLSSISWQSLLGWGWTVCPFYFSMLELVLAWVYLSLMHAVITSGSSHLHLICCVQKTVFFVCLFCSKQLPLTLIFFLSLHVQCSFGYMLKSYIPGPCGKCLTNILKNLHTNPHNAQASLPNQQQSDK